MYQKKIYLLLLLPVLLAPCLQAQNIPFRLNQIENYHFSETGGGEQNWNITSDHRGVIYVANNDNGILEFDGSDWRTIPGTEGRGARSLVTGENGVVYAGLEGDFGMLEPGSGGSMHFRSLADSLMRSRFPDINIWKCWYGNGRVYFCGMEAIFVFDPSSGDLEHLETSEYAFLSYLVGKDLYSSDYAKGLLKHDGKTFVALPGGEYFREKNIFGLVAMDPRHLLVGMIDEGLVLFNTTEGSVDSTFMDSRLRQELVTARLTNLMIRDDKIFVGTMNGGLYILNKKGEITDIITQRQGLISQTISHVYAGPDFPASSSIWIAHWKGISRMEINNPLRRVSLGRGGMGFGGMGSDEAITDIAEFSGALFVAAGSELLQASPVSASARFRPIGEINEPIFDLQAIEPAPGVEFLLVSGREHIRVLDQRMRIENLQGAGRIFLPDPVHPDVFYAGGREFTAYQFKNGKWENFLRIDLDGEIFHMCMDKERSVWISTSSGLKRIDHLGVDTAPRIVANLDSGLPSDLNYGLYADPESGGLLVGTSMGFYRFDYVRDSMVFDTLYNRILPAGRNKIISLHPGTDGLLWFSFENEQSGNRILGAGRTTSVFDIVHDRPFRTLSPAIPTEIFYSDPEKQLWFARAGELYQFLPDLASEEKEPFQVLMREVIIPEDSMVFYGTHYTPDPTGFRIPRAVQSPEEVPRLDFKERDIEFRWSSTYYQSRWQLRYSYCLQGFNRDWSHWERNSTAKFTNLPHGRYMMLVKARNVYGEESPPASYAFTVLRPWYATVLAISLYLILFAALIISVSRYTRNLRRRALELEKKNREIEKQKRELENLNEEITSQRDEIESQRDSLAAQKELIDSQKTAMTDSIHYAKRIQDAVLPAKEVMRYLLPKHFVFYRPRDIVSGDFYWVDKRDESVLVAVADCTGHGVPGAFMSMLGISLLNEISSKFSNNPTNELMDELRDRVIAALGQTGDKYETRDGIEMSLVAINTNTREVQFTGANHNLHTFQRGELVIVNGDSMPVGIHSDSSTLFSATTVKLNRGDTLYMFSDGFIDQFGGGNRKKFGTKQLRTLFAGLQNNIMLDQKTVIEKTYDDWKGSNEQIDDVLIVGIKL